MIEMNGKIIDTMLGIEDHGIMTFMLDINFGNSTGQGFGGYSLEGGTGKSMKAVRKVLETVGVDKWEDLKGKYIRVRKEQEFGVIDSIGNIVEDRWFSMKEHYASE